MALKTELKIQGDYLFKNRSYLPLLFLVIGLGVYLYGIYDEPAHFEKSRTSYYEFICLGICLFGLLVRVLTVAHTPKNTSGRVTTEGQLADELNTTGMYSLVRHPLYVGNFFMWLGVAMLTGNLWFIIAFILLYWVYYERIMYAEEDFLINKFGDSYTRWSKNTPAFIPSFRNFQKAQYPFCFNKVLKQEKNGLAAIFLLFWLFDWSGSQVKARALHIEFDVWFYAAIVSSIFYLILKVMKKRKMLSEINS